MPSIPANGGTVYIRDTGFINYSTDGISYTAVTFPCTIVNTSVTESVKVIFQTNLTFTDINQYFICGSDKIQFGDTSLINDGSRPRIDVMVNNYPGLIQNGDSLTPGYNDIYVFNLEVNGVSYSLIDGGGWIGQAYFGNLASNNRIINCQTSGDIPLEGGGIVGTYSKNIRIHTCNTFGAISAEGGGIAGRGCENLEVLYCYSGLDVATNGGGIVGSYAINCSANSCYTAGTIASGAGGIFGRYANTCQAIACSSLGAIDTGEGGGIFGANSTDSSATNCYSTGAIGPGSGGIFGSSITNSTAVNCYTSGYSSITSGGIYADNDVNGGNNLSEANPPASNSGTWTDTNANLVLLGTSGDINSKIWFSEGPNTRYKTFIGHSLYTVDNINTSLTGVVNTYAFTVPAGTFTSGIISPIGFTVSILEKSPSSTTVTIPNISTGAIATKPETAPDTYTLIINSQSMGFYVLTKVILTVTSPSPSPSPPSGSVYNALSRAIGASCGIVTGARGSFAVAAAQNGKPLKFNSYEGYLKYKKAINDRS